MGVESRPVVLALRAGEYVAVISPSSEREGWWRAMGLGGRFLY